MSSASGQQISFSSLPVELQIAIVEELYESQHMRSDAAWERPYCRADTRIDQLRKSRLDNDPIVVRLSIEEDSISPDALLTTSLCSTIRSLRLISRSFNALCAPLLYREMDVHWLSQASNSELVNSPITLQPEHVRSIRIHTSRGGRDGAQWKDQISSMATVLAKCNNLRSIAIYYDYEEGHLGQLWDQVLSIMKGGNVVDFGIYSIHIMESTRAAPSRDYGFPYWMVGHLVALLSSDAAVKNLQRLDLVMEGISPGIFDLLRISLPSLRSLTIRRAMRNLYFGSYEPFQMHLWGAYRNLTQAQFIYCEPAHAYLMIDFVRQFPTLEELMWASCGSRPDTLPPLPLDGWSKLDEALCNNRQPLRKLYIQHALDWELWILGQIPVIELTIDDFDEQMVARAFARTKEMYLGMRTLHILPEDLTNPPQQVEGLNEEQTDDGETSTKPKLEDICAERQITLLRDASVMF
ncbi:hypothetical protein FRC17_007318, partial [Serendipita sp. 399]